jgi:hypothetical protein
MATPAVTPQVLAPITVAAVQKSNFLVSWFHSFVNFFKKAPTWISIAQTVLPYSVLIANGVLMGVAPELLAVAMPIEAEVQADLTTIAVLTKKGQNTPSLTDAVDRLKANFDGLAESLHIKDPLTLQKISTVVTQLDLLLNILAPAAPAPEDTPAASMTTT